MLATRVQQKKEWQGVGCSWEVICEICSHRLYLEGSMTLSRKHEKHHMMWVWISANVYREKQTCHVLLWLTLCINLTGPWVSRYLVKHNSGCVRDGVSGWEWWVDWVKQTALPNGEVNFIQSMDILKRTCRLSKGDCSLCLSLRWDISLLLLSDLDMVWSLQH